jgi:hypothetical protein
MLLYAAYINMYYTLRPRQTLSEGEREICIIYHNTHTRSTYQRKTSGTCCTITNQSSPTSTWNRYTALVKFRPKGLLAMAASDVTVVRADLLLWPSWMVHLIMLGFNGYPRLGYPKNQNPSNPHPKNSKHDYCPLLPSMSHMNKNNGWLFPCYFGVHPIFVQTDSDRDVTWPSIVHGDFPQICSENCWRISQTGVALTYHSSTDPQQEQYHSGWGFRLKSLVEFPSCGVGSIPTNLEDDVCCPSKAPTAQTGRKLFGSQLLADFRWF